MEVASSACNGDCSSSKQSRASGQEPNLMDKDGGALMIHPSLQLELKISWLAETDLGRYLLSYIKLVISKKRSSILLSDTC